MAYPFQEPTGLTQEQAEVLRELNSFHQFSESEVWKKVMLKMQEMVDEAQESLLGCKPTTGAEKRGILSIRWQQREAMRRGLMEFINSQLNERQKLLDEIKEQETNEHSDSNPGPLAGTDHQ